DQGRHDGVYVPRSLTTAYCNTIPPEREEKSSGDRAIEHRLRSIIRWNAMAIILRANKDSSELGGHIASFQSAATLYDIGFGHFWHAPTDTHGGDLLFIQGHSSPGIYARAFLAAASPTRRRARSGPSWATAKWTSPSRWARFRWPAVRAWTTSSSSSTATCSAWTARCAVTARSCRSSRACSAAAAGTSSRCCGAAAG